MSTGEQAELERFCAEAYPSLVAALTHHTGDLYLAEELAQESLVRACDRWEKVRQLDSPIAWTFRVGVNLSHSHFRRKAAERRAHHRHGPRVDRHDTADTSDQIAVQAALSKLTKQQREAVVLRYFLGLDAEQAARSLRTTPGAIRGLTHRAVEALRGILDLDGELREATDAS